MTTRHRPSTPARLTDCPTIRRAAGGAAALIGAALFAGCSSRPAFHYDAHLAPAGQVLEPVAEAPAMVAEATAVVSAVDAREGVGDVAVLTGPPGAVKPAPGPISLGAGDGGAPAPPPAARADAAAPPVLVDAVIGQINGRPVYASEFFAPMDAQLRAEAKQLTEREWLATARKLINDALWRVIKDELLLAEFEASLTPEQRVGLLAFISDIQTGLIRENYGSHALARKRLEEEGGSLEEEVKRRRDQELIRAQLRRAIADRLYVSWRDVQSEYERNPQKYNPPGVATLRMIWVDRADAERIARVEAALGAGAPFADVAGAESDFRRDDGGLVPPVTLDGPTFAESTIFRVEALNAPARMLEQGGTVGPFDYEGRKVWIHLESLTEPNRTLFDLQLDIYNDLFSQRFGEETERYLTELMERGVITHIQQMQDDLFRIAADRYLLQGR